MDRPDEAAAATEFDQWANAGRAESMAEGHRGVTEAAIAGWTLGTADAVLDVGCGNGWAVQELVKRGAGKGYGVDIAPRMIDLARGHSQGDARFEFEVSPAEKLPFRDAHMSHVLNVESLYYYPDPGAALVEWARVTRPGGRLAIVVDLYEESPATHAWIDALDVNVHLLSSPNICAMAQAAGWTNIRSEQVLDPRPLKPEAGFTISKYWPSYQMYLDYRSTGALVVHAVR
jgi:ubiquinone/menaquinone biosynthesis C-methylase UbiE